MPRVLILYGTTDGHTAKVAAALANDLMTEGCRVEAIDARTASPEARPENYDGIIVAASIHARGYQRPVRRWVHEHATALNSRPTAFLSVCLGILERRPEAQREVREIMARFLARAGWQPAESLPIAGALPYTRYSWWKKWVMKRIMVKAGGDTDTTRDFEYTDWDALRTFAHEFAGRVEAIHMAGTAS